MRLACDLKTLCSVKREKLAALEAAKADKPKKVTILVAAIVSCVLLLMVGAWLEIQQEEEQGEPASQYRRRGH